MREYLFRGKRKDNKEWVYGSLVNCLFANDSDKSACCYIVPDPKLNWDMPYYDCWEDLAQWVDNYEVIPETVGEYMRMVDAIGNKIFESDVLRGKFWTGLGGKSTKYKEFNYSVSYHDGDSHDFYINMPKDYGNYRFLPKISQSSVIGNLHDHPELLQSL